MNKTGVYICGVVTGVIVTIVGLVSYASCQGRTSKDLVYFDKPAEPVKERAFKVIQVLEPGVALVNGDDDPDDNPEDKTYFGPTYMLVNDDGKYYSDEEIITVGVGEEARKVGVYNYETRGGFEKTVSIIKIMRK